MIKYELIPEQLLYEGTITNDQLFEPEAVKMEIAALVHEQEYLNKLIRHQLTPAEIRRSGFPMSPALIEREFIIAGGTCTCSDSVWDRIEANRDCVVSSYVGE